MQLISQLEFTKSWGEAVNTGLDLIFEFNLHNNL